MIDQYDLCTTRRVYTRLQHIHTGNKDARSVATEHDESGMFDFDSVGSWLSIVSKRIVYLQKYNNVLPRLKNAYVRVQNVSWTMCV